MAYSNPADYRIAGRDATEPGREAFAITAAGTDLTKYPKALWLNATGTVTGIPIDSPDDTSVSFTVATTGLLPIGFRRISACPTGTLGLR